LILPRDDVDRGKPPTWQERSKREIACSTQVAAGDRSWFRPDEIVLDGVTSRLYDAELRSQKATDDNRFGPLNRGDQLDVVVWSFDRRPDVLDLVRWLRTSRRGDLARRRPVVAPNYVLRGLPKWQGGPAGPPRNEGAQLTLTAPDPVISRKASPHIATLDTGYVVEDLPDALLSALRPDDDDRDRLDVDGDGALESQNGHGTFIAGLVQRLDNTLVIDPGRVLDSAGIGDDASVAFELTQTTAPVINMSWGGCTEDDLAPVALTDVVRRLSHDRALVAAAGNEALSAVHWPAGFKSVLAVAAYGLDDNQQVVPAEFSNYGHWVDVCAPGVDLLSTYVTVAEDLAVGQPGFSGAARWDGTSFAAPQVAAMLAVKMRDGMTNHEAVLDLLDNDSTFVPEMAEYGRVVKVPVDLRR
jgi:hypothetical protein